MNAVSARLVPPPAEPNDALFDELEAIYFAQGFRAAHTAAHDALKRLAEEHRAELTRQGWCV